MFRNEIQLQILELDFLLDEISWGNHQQILTKLFSKTADFSFNNFQ